MDRIRKQQVLRGLPGPSTNSLNINKQPARRLIYIHSDRVAYKLGRIKEMLDHRNCDVNRNRAIFNAIPSSQKFSL
jgi:hypothetical protein